MGYDGFPTGKKPRTKAPRIQRLVTPRVLQHKRRRIALKRKRTQKNKEEASEYAKLLAKRMKVWRLSELHWLHGISRLRCRSVHVLNMQCLRMRSDTFFANRRPKRSARNRSPRGAAFPRWEPPHPNQSPARSEILKSNKVFAEALGVTSWKTSSGLRWNYSDLLDLLVVMARGFASKLPY